MTDDSRQDDDDVVARPIGPGGETLENRMSFEERPGQKKKGHRRIDKDTGEVTYKKVPTSTIMGAIQLGMYNSLGRLGMTNRDLLLQDFSVVESVFFPGEGSERTTSHLYSDFKFKTYAPTAFRYFRDLFGIQPDAFLSSLCNEPLRELSNPGASGSIFYITEDDEYIIKTVQHKEAEFLQKLMPGYYMNVVQNPRTLLPKFFGLYTFQNLGKNIRLLIMNNLLPSNVTMHQKYDLKGSTYKRRASKNERDKKSPTLKDLDFLDDHPDGLFLEATTLEALLKTISRDCLVLESFKIMDYSLLLGIHNLDQAERDKEAAEMSGGEEPCSSRGVEPMLRKVIRQKSMFTSAMAAIQAKSAEMPVSDELEGGIPAWNVRGDKLLMYIGVIDILQSYRTFKKLEHTWKAMLHDGDTISVHRPSFYANRFQEFMQKNVFKKIPAQTHSQTQQPPAKSGSSRTERGQSTKRERQHRSTRDKMDGIRRERPIDISSGPNDSGRTDPGSPSSPTAAAPIMPPSDIPGPSTSVPSDPPGSAKKIDRLFDLTTWTDSPRGARHPHDMAQLAPLATQESCSGDDQPGTDRYSNIRVTSSEAQVQQHVTMLRL